jgi:hypothetical protein
MNIDPERLVANIRSANTEDLLDRMTVYREDMLPEALDLIAAELLNRGIDTEAITRHEQRRSEAVRDADGRVRTCSFCRKPAVASGLRWHRVFGLIPLFPRRFYWCDDHAERRS